MPLVTRRGLLIILSSPSGAGKTTLARRLMAWDATLSFSVSATTRAPRAGEQDGREYYFRSPDEFQAMVHSGEMLEHAEVFGHFYGSPLAPVVRAINAGRDVLFDIDWQGGQQVCNSSLADEVVTIFILPPTIAALEDRLNARAQDSAEVIAARMTKSENEISHWAEYSYVLVNDDIERCTDQLKSIINAERLKRARQPALLAHVQRLNAEFEDRQK